MSAVQIVTADSADNSVPFKPIDVTCPGGKKVLGGGARLFGAGGDVAIDESYPTDASTWHAVGYEVIGTALSWHISAYAICANTGS